MDSPTCSRCDRPVLAAGLCQTHYYSREEKARRAAIRAAPRVCATCSAPLINKSSAAVYCSDPCKARGWQKVEKAASLERRTGRLCVVCGNVVQSLAGRAKTCSRECGIRWANVQKQERRRAEWNATEHRCPQCGEAFPTDRRAGSVYCSPECKKKAMDARWRERSPHYMRRYLYGVTPEQTAAMLAAQANRCAICEAEFGSGRNAVHMDHDHTTGKVRALLCGPCNNGLGLFKDDPARLRAAAAYLEAHTM